jgi:large subunit ribosomal protein L10
MTRHTRPWKEKEVAEITRLASEYPVIAVANIESFPASLSASLRKKLQKEGTIVKVSKTRVAKKGLEQASVNTEKLMPYVDRMIALLFTQTNPFELFGFLKKNKGNLSAKAGQIAQADIIVPAGDTGLPPGPALSDLKGAGLKVKVEGSTIAVIADKVVTESGKEISAAVAGTLSKLDIKPMKVGLNLSVCFEDDSVYLPSVLDIDTDKVFNNFVTARQRAFMLALGIEYFNSETMPHLIAKGFQNAKSVALEGDIMNKYTVGSVLAKAHAHAVAIKALVKDAPKEETVPSEKEGAASEEKGKAETDSAAKTVDKPAEKSAEKAEAQPATEDVSQESTDSEVK